MKRLAAFLLVFVVGLARPAHADSDPVLDAATPAEKALNTKLDAGQYVKARDEAETLLAQNPESFLAAWAMTLIEHNEEANHARALYYVRRATELLIKHFGKEPHWHKKVMLEETEILFEMDRNEEGLALLDQENALYGPASPERRIWALFKLGHPDEARELATKMASSDDFVERAMGANSMLAIEFEAHNREAEYHWSLEAIRLTQENDGTILRNAAGGAFIHFRLDQAEDFALRAHKAEYKGIHNGYDQLAGLYLAEGEFGKSLSALDELKGEHIERRYRPQYALNRREILADVLYGLGKIDEAEKMDEELYVLPDRTGETSGSKAMERLNRTFRYYVALDAKLVLERERASYRPMLAGVSVDVLRMIGAHWEVRRALMQLLSQGDLLLTLTRPNLQEITDWDTWRVGSLIDIVGSGVLLNTVSAARALDAAFPEAGPYLDALAGEIAYRDGDLARADQLGTAALAKLPREEALVRWRAMAWNADALRRLGRMDAAQPLYHEVLEKFPTVLRILDLQVPVTITTDGSELAKGAADKLGGSTRFVVTSKAPFRLNVSAVNGNSVQICLTDVSGSQFQCVTGDAKNKASDAIMFALDAFHAAAFSPKISLKQTDLNSLDGTPIRVNVDEVLKGVLAP